MKIFARLLIGFIGVGLVALVLVLGQAPPAESKVEVLQDSNPYATLVQTLAVSVAQIPTALPTAIPAVKAQAAAPSPTFEQVGLNGPAVNNAVVPTSTLIESQTFTQLLETSPTEVKTTPILNADFSDATEAIKSVIAQGIDDGRYTFPPDMRPSLSDAQILVEMPHAIAYVSMHDADEGYWIMRSPDAIPLVNINGVWLANYPGEAEYVDNLFNLPSKLLSDVSKSAYVLQLGLSQNSAYYIQYQSIYNAGTLPWGCDSHQVTQGWHNGYGIDFGGGNHWEVRASHDGVIASVFFDSPTDSGAYDPALGNLGNRIIVDHRDGTATLYLHLVGRNTHPQVDQLAYVGKPVSQGDLIGYADHTGYSSGPHLHYQVQPWPGNGSWYQYGLEIRFLDEINLPGGLPYVGASYTSRNCFINSNQPPTAAPDFAETVEDMPVNIAVLANDTDPEARPLSVAAVTQPANGVAVLNADNTVTYTPNPGFSGQDSFSYTASDGELTADSTVTVTVIPFALQSHADYSYCGDEPHSDTISITGVGSRQLRGQIIVDYVVGNQRVLIEKYPVDHRGPADFSQIIELPGVSDEYIFMDPTIGKRVFEVHVDIQIEVLDANGNFVRNPDGSIKTFGVDSGDYDTYCLESKLPTPTPEPTAEATPVVEFTEEAPPTVEVTEEAPIIEAPPVEQTAEAPLSSPEQPPAVEMTAEATETAQ